MPACSFEALRLIDADKSIYLKAQSSGSVTLPLQPPNPKLKPPGPGLTVMHAAAGPGGKSSNGTFLVYGRASLLIL